MYNKITFKIYEKITRTVANLKKDIRGIDGYVVTGSLIALAAGIAILTMTPARTTIANIWNNTLQSVSNLFSNLAAGQ